MVGIVLVSHSAKIAEGTRDIALQMAQGDVKIAAVGGTSDGRLGNNPDAIYRAILELGGDDGVMVVSDFGGSSMAVATVLDMLPEDVSSKVRVANAPFVEGAVAAVLQASLGDDLDSVVKTAEDAIDIVRDKRRD